MEIIPVIYISGKKIYLQKSGPPLSIDDFLDKEITYEMLYLLDNDGITYDKPNFGLYTQLSQRYSLWVDAAPRTLDDVVDQVFAGAANITIRKPVLHGDDYLSIRELTEDKLYLALDAQELKHHGTYIRAPGIDGTIAIADALDLMHNLFIKDSIRSLSHNNTLYALESNPENFNFWRTINLAGLIVELQEIEKVQTHAG
jgi:hypothetical protein